MPLPRTFTPHELHTLTHGQVLAMPPEDRRAYNTQLLALWEATTLQTDTAYLSGDYDPVGSNRRFEIGE